MDVLLNLLRGLFGMAVLLLVIYLLSENRRAISWRTVGMAIVLQFTFAALVLYFSPARAAIEWVGARFIDLLAFTNAGVSLLFGSLADKSRHGVVFAVMILPSIIFFSALSSLLYYLGILQRVVYAFAWVMSKTLRLSGAETLSASANIFLGQTEAPFLVKPYLAGMTRSELLTIMVGGMATIAGAVMMAYIAFLGGDDPKQQMMFATHLITASVINAPAGLMIAKMLVPQTQPVDHKLTISKEKLGCNAVDAVCLGTSEGLKLAVNVGAMLIAFTALVTMVNAMLGWLGTPGTLLLGETRFSYPGLNAWVSSVTGGAFPGLSLEFLFGVLYAPVAWLIGIDH
ncbi:MAG: Na+ dependent nucleoside transporter, partial [Verrucomicrobia bacterium]|nr:Na+ dependent nucleoside transporter [Verrucomicrobiota bacterium]